MQINIKNNTYLKIKFVDLVAFYSAFLCTHLLTAQLTTYLWNRIILKDCVFMYRQIIRTSIKDSRAL